jgi:hypothetical protein
LGVAPAGSVTLFCGAVIGAFDRGAVIGVVADSIVTGVFDSGAVIAACDGAVPVAPEAATRTAADQSGHEHRGCEEPVHAAHLNQSLGGGM